MVRLYSSGLLLAALSSTYAETQPAPVDSASKARHDASSRPLELNVDAKATYNDKFMALIESPCRPETDGFFGATYGEPVKISYGFRLEAQPLSPILEVLDVVEDKIVGGILTNSFPQLCGFQRSRRLASASGFRFFKFQEAAPCTPSESESDFCGVFTGQLNMYGHEKDEAADDLLRLVDAVLNPSDPSQLHPALVEMSSELDYLRIAGVNVSLPGQSKSNTLGWAGMGLTLFIFFLVAWWYFIRNDKQGDTGKSEDRGLGWRQFSSRRSRMTANYDPEEKSIKPSYEAEAVAFGGGSKVLLEDGKPVLYSDEIELEDPSATGHMV